MLTQSAHKPKTSLPQTKLTTPTLKLTKKKKKKQKNVVIYS